MSHGDSAIGITPPFFKELLGEAFLRFIFSNFLETEATHVSATWRRRFESLDAHDLPECRKQISNWQ
jgi:hypothetical protein